MVFIKCSLSCCLSITVTVTAGTASSTLVIFLYFTGRHPQNTTVQGPGVKTQWPSTSQVARLGPQMVRYAGQLRTGFCGQWEVPGVSFSGGSRNLKVGG